MDIRRANSEDCAVIASVLAASFDGYEPQYTPAAYDTTTLDPERVGVRLSQGPLWVVEIDGAIVGTVGAVLKGEVMYIRGMAVLPAARGQRIGDLLLRAIEEYAREHGATSLALGTTPFLDRAISLYNRYGFTRDAEPAPDLFGTPIFTMTKRLST